ncbi:MAG: hypothetical protein JXB49_35435 [Bacteroidales bacterium]|nr:hypothetical protein [Bacteroidales bacterium]
MKKSGLLLVFALFLSSLCFSQTKGDKVNVLWNGQVYASTVLEVKDGKFKIHYDGWGSEWDEWVGKERLVLWKKGDKVNVLWKEKWYASTVLDFKDGKYKIHYDGWSDEWDEWVTCDRIKKK